MKHLALFIILVTFCTPSFSQKKDTIVLMNGNVIIEPVLDSSLFAVTVPNAKKPGKNLHYEFQDLYCVHYHHGETRYFYRQDTTISHWFTREEMGYYVKGEADGRKGFKARGAMIGGGIMGFIGGATGSFFAPILPYGFMGLSGITRIRIRHNTISNPAYIDHDPYILGYERSARYKRKLKSLFGGTIGLAVGYGFYFALKDFYPTEIKNGKIVFK